jgi:hypothetical protein
MFHKKKIKIINKIYFNSFSNLNRLIYKKSLKIIKLIYYKVNNFFIITKKININN